MRTLLPLLVVAFSLGCTEYDLVGDGTVFGEPNPQDLSTPVKTDRIVQVTVPSVDVLWVIDTSCSMSQEQTALAANFDMFMQYFLDSGLDYHIGVVTTNMDAPTDSGYEPTMYGRLQVAGGFKFIDPLTPDPIGIFKGMAVDYASCTTCSCYAAGGCTDRHYDEMGLAATYAALELRRDTDNFGFFREDANLAVIVLSDEDDYSQYYENPIQPPFIISWLQSLKPFPDMVSYSSIVGDDFGGYSTCNTAAEPGRKYLQVTNAIGGVTWSICDSAHWDQALAQLGMQAAGLRREFFLSEVPIEESIDVWVEEDGTVVNDTVEWTYNRPRNSVTLNTFVPEPLQEVFISYEVLAAAQ